MFIGWIQTLSRERLKSQSLGNLGLYILNLDCSDVGEICWRKKVCWWRIFCMLVKLYVGEYRNLNVCWWSMLVKNLLYVGEKYCMLVKILYGNLNVCWWSMLVKFFLHVGEKYEQKFKCMLVKCVGENFPVCWWKVFSWKKFSFHQHTGFSPTSFTNIIIANKVKMQALKDIRKRENGVTRKVYGFRK